MSLRRILFASCHGYIDPSSGAAWATRDVLELLAARGVECRVITTGVLSYERETELATVLRALDVPLRTSTIFVGQAEAVDAFEFELGGVGVTVIRTASSRIERSPNRVESQALVDRVEQTLDDLRPQVVLTYGGHPANLALMAAARRRGIPVAFHLHNVAYGPGPYIRRRHGADRPFGVRPPPLRSATGPRQHGVAVAVDPGAHDRRQS